MRRHRLTWPLLIFASFVTTVMGQESPPPATPVAPTEIPIEYRPYSVAIDVHLAAGLETVIPYAEAWLSELRSAIHREAGPRWISSLQFVPDATWARPAVWRVLNSTSAGEHIPVHTEDFIYLVRMQSVAGALTADVCVWEPMVKFLSPVRTVRVQDPRELCDQLGDALWTLFRPRAHWQQVDDFQARLQVQAGGLGVDAGLPPLIAPGEAFVPWIILRKRDQSIDRTVPQFWTYLIADPLQDGRGTARIVSGLRNPLSLKPRGRVEFVAVAARPQWDETTITFRRQSTPPQVLAAHETLWQADQFPIDESNPLAVHRQLTDRAGQITLQHDPESRLGWLTISSGRQLLARLPVVPGEEPAREVMLPDDRLRLQVEGQLQLVESDLVSFVATRTALMAITRAAAKKSEWDAVDARLKQLDALPTPQSFADRVSAIRVNAIALARQQKDRTTEQRIARMADDTLELVSRYLNDDKIAVLKEEAAELRKADTEAAELLKGKKP